MSRFRPSSSDRVDVAADFGAAKTSRDPADVDVDAAVQAFEDILGITARPFRPSPLIGKRKDAFGRMIDTEIERTGVGLRRLYHDLPEKMRAQTDVNDFTALCLDMSRRTEMSPDLRDAVAEAYRRIPDKDPSIASVTLHTNGVSVTGDDNRLGRGFGAVSRADHLSVAADDADTAGDVRDEPVAQTSAKPFNWFPEIPKSAIRTGRVHHPLDRPFMVEDRVTPAQQFLDKLSKARVDADGCIQNDDFLAMVQKEKERTGLGAPGLHRLLPGYLQEWNSKDRVLHLISLKRMGGRIDVTLAREIANIYASTADVDGTPVPSSTGGMKPVNGSLEP